MQPFQATAIFFIPFLKRSFLQSLGPSGGFGGDGLAQPHSGPNSTKFWSAAAAAPHEVVTVIAINGAMGTPTDGKIDM